ncbi:MAG: hypothetical protein GWN00_29870 [Aliifodinibius sp.]|nr:hypothetical protein [Fodinibius sp.]NIV15009.1 hypothetical protein [Fodinibius sp.]NIY28846.1 hypothetical protein [Fodinibius sp.]
MTSSPAETVLFAVAVNVVSVVDADTLDMPVTSTPFIRRDIVAVPEIVLTRKEFIVRASKASSNR